MRLRINKKHGKTWKYIVGAVTPLKTNGWHMSSWRWKEDHFPFFSWVICRFQPLIFQGVAPKKTFTIDMSEFEVEQVEHVKNKHSRVQHTYPHDFSAILLENWSYRQLMNTTNSSNQRISLQKDQAPSPINFNAGTTAICFCQAIRVKNNSPKSCRINISKSP